MRSRSYTSSFRRSLLLGAAIVAAAQTLLFVFELPSPTLFAQTRISHRYLDLRRYAEKRDGVDVVIMGFSRALNGVDPGILEERTGLRVFNMSMASTDLVTQSRHMRDYVIPRWQPRIVLWGLPFAARSRFKDNYQVAGSPGMDILAMPGGHRAIEWANDLMWFQRRPLTDWAFTILNPRDRRTDERGFRANLWRLDDPRPRGRRGPAFRDDQLDRALPLQSRLVLPPAPDRFVPDETFAPYTEEYALGLFEDTLKLAADRGVRVLTFTVPVTMARLWNERGWTRKVVYAERMNALLAKYGVPMADYRWYPPISETLGFYYDRSHLNVDGAALFTEILYRSLLAEDAYVPEDRREIFSYSERLAASWTPMGRRELGRVK